MSLNATKAFSSHFFFKVFESSICAIKRQEKVIDILSMVLCHCPCLIYCLNNHCVTISDPLIKPRDFRVDPTQGNRPHEAHFIWESIDPLDEMIRGKFRGYKVRSKAEGQDLRKSC